MTRRRNCFTRLWAAWRRDETCALETKIMATIEQINTAMTTLDADVERLIALNSSNAKLAADVEATLDPVLASIQSLDTKVLAAAPVPAV